MGIFPRTIFHSEMLTDVRAERTEYFGEMQKRFRSVDLIFFDPDNGIEVKSRPLGRRGSCKYLYWDELTQTYNSGHSVLVYQHFNREPRDHFVERISCEVKKRTGASVVFSFRTSHVIFLLIPQLRNEQYFRQRISDLKKTWRDQFNTSQH